MPGGVQQVWGLPQLGRGDGLVGGVNQKAGCFERFEVCFKQLCFREVAWKSRFCGQKRYVNFMKIQTFSVVGYPTFIHLKHYTSQHPRFNETFLLIASIFCDLEMELMNSNQIWERKLMPWKREHLKKPDGLPTVSGGSLVFGVKTRRRSESLEFFTLQHGVPSNRNIYFQLVVSNIFIFNRTVPGEMIQFYSEFSDGLKWPTYISTDMEISEAWWVSPRWILALPHGCCIWRYAEAGGRADVER